MTKVFLLEPEVAGGWGPRTVVTNQQEVEAGIASTWNVSYLEYMFDGWLGDELLTTHPCYIVTDSLAIDLQGEGLSGVQMAPVAVSTSELFQELYPDRELPHFQRLIPQGTARVADDGKLVEWSGHDLCLTPRGDLIVSEPCLEVLRRHRLKHCKIQELEAENINQV